MVDPKLKEVGRLGAGGALAIALTISVIPALLIGAGFAQISNAISATSMNMLNVVSIGTLLALTAILFWLVQIREEIRTQR